MTVCVRSSDRVERMGAPCPECQHTNLVHPNLGNPALTECAVCRLLATSSTVTVEPGWRLRIAPSAEVFYDGTVAPLLRLERIEPPPSLCDRLGGSVFGCVLIEGHEQPCQPTPMRG